MQDLFEPLNDAEYEELEEFLLSLDNDDSIYCVSALDGFLTAVVSGPEPIQPSEWLPVVWGGEEYAPTWESPEMFERIFVLMARLMNSGAVCLMESPEEFQAIFVEQKLEEGGTALVVDEWCYGYLKGVALRADLWDGMPHLFDDYLAPILLFGHEDCMAQLDTMDFETRQFWREQVEPAARRIHAYWLGERRKTDADPEWDSDTSLLEGHSAPFQCDGPRTGPDDPCRCGSGKIFKHCCGAH